MIEQFDAFFPLDGVHVYEFFLVLPNVGELGLKYDELALAEAGESRPGPVSLKESELLDIIRALVVTGDSGGLRLLVKALKLRLEYELVEVLFTLLRSDSGSNDKDNFYNGAIP